MATLLNIFSVAGVQKNDDLDCWEFSTFDESKKLDGEQSEESHDESPHPSKKKKRRSKKKGNKQHLKKVVRWGQVQEILFSRAVAYDGIPSSGGYPLGLGELIGEFCFALVDDAPTNEKPRTRNTTKTSHQIEEIIKEQASPSPLAEIQRSRLLGHNKADNIGEINKDIKSIRESRQSIGCGCKPLKVDKLNVNKLKAEIRRRQSSETCGEIEGMKKADLIRVLRELLKESRLCADPDCECVKLEIQCSPLACSCACGSGNIIKQEGESEDPIGNPHEQQDRVAEDDSCGNPFGKDTFDFEKVQLHRKQILQQTK